MLNPILADAATPIARPAATDPAATPVAAEQAGDLSAVASRTGISTSEPADQACPTCGATLVEREAKRGARKSEDHERHTIRIDREGRTPIPKPMREAMGLADGGEAVAWLEGEKLVVEPREA